ncbi:hypothetical protein ACJW31_10G107400 [Castanea mollissima]
MENHLNHPNPRQQIYGEQNVGHGGKPKTPQPQQHTRRRSTAHPPTATIQPIFNPPWQTSTTANPPRRSAAPRPPRPTTPQTHYDPDSQTTTPPPPDPTHPSTSRLVKTRTETHGSASYSLDLCFVGVEA